MTINQKKKKNYGSNPNVDTPLQAPKSIAILKLDRLGLPVTVLKVRFPSIIQATIAQLITFILSLIFDDNVSSFPY